MPQKAKISAAGFTALVYNCVYSVICVVLCAMAFDRRQIPWLGEHNYQEAQIVSPAYAVILGSLVTLCSLFALYFFWRQWWREVRK